MVIVLLPVLFFASAVTAATFFGYLNDDSASLGSIFDGVGAITSNGETRLIYDYPEQQRNDILDIFFTPGVGMALQILKIEVGSDVQSTLGTESSFQHNRGEKPACDRGIQFWYASEAKKRNPNIKIAVLEWSAPGWIGNGSFFSDDNINYIVQFLECLSNDWNVTADYLGIWNEPPISEVPIDYLLSLRKSLDTAGFQHVKIDATDAGVGSAVSENLVKDLLANSSLRTAIPIVSFHHPCSSLPASFSSLSQEYGTIPWSSEDYSLIGDAEGAKCWSITPSRNWLEGNATATIAWGVAFSAYPNALCQLKGFLYAMNPWDGSYQTTPGIWSTAIYTWFTSPGYTFLNRGHGSDFLPANSNSTSHYVTFVSPLNGDGSRDFTTLILTQECTASCFTSSNSSAGTLSLTISGGLNKKAQSLGFLYLWAANVTAPLTLLGTIPVTVINSTTSLVSVDFQPNTSYALTSLLVSQKPWPANNQVSDVFPMPFQDTFQTAPLESYGKYFADWDGSFQVVQDPYNPSTQVFRQQVLQSPIKWHCVDVNPISMTAPGYANYDVSVSVRIDGNTTMESLRGRNSSFFDFGTAYTSSLNPRIEAPSQYSEFLDYAYASLVTRIGKPFSGWCPVQTGYSLSIFGNGTWSLQILPANAGPLPSNLVLAAGPLTGNPVDTWHRLRMVHFSNSLIAYVDGQQVASILDQSFDAGMVGLSSNYHFASFSSFSFNQVGPSAGPNVFSTSYLDAGLTNNFTGLVGVVIVPLQEITLTGFARFASAGGNRTHMMYLIQAADNSTVANAFVDMSESAIQADPYGFIYGTLDPGNVATLSPGNKYYVVSQEEQGGDHFYFYGPSNVCAGDATVRSPVVQVRKAFAGLFDVLGTVYKSSASSEWVEMNEGYERSLGPVSFLLRN
jgi:Glycosyl hydrolase family 59